MSRFNLRQKPRISYYEPEELDLDEYIFCDTCGDYVYEYCSVHGPLLVIPDDKMPVNVPAHIPRATLTIPHVFLHLAPSSIPGAGLGVFASLTLPSGVQFGPYRGKYTNEIRSMYCWQIHDQNNRSSHVVDAADENDSNWMRYVNCSRHWFEQNLVAYQYQGQIYYRTIKIIPRCTELLVFYGTEFASSLRIDLKHYNSPFGYEHKDDIYRKSRIETLYEDCDKEILATKKDVNGNSCTENIKLPRNLPDNHNLSIKYGNRALQDTLHDKAKNKSNTHLDSGSNINMVKKTIVICNECNEHFDSKPPLIQHLQAHNKTHKKIFICNICKFEESDEEIFMKHLRDQHKVSDLQQPNDTNNNNYNTAETLTSPAEPSEQNNQYTLGLPKIKYQQLINIEILNEGGNSGPDKLHTDLFFTNNVSQGNKTDLYTDKEKIECPICKKTFNRYEYLRRHTRRHTSEKQFSCNICEKAFWENYELKRHLSSHNQKNPLEKKYSCSVCQEIFFSIKCLNKHRKTHTDEKPFVCTVCEKKFKGNKSLKIHILSHNPNRRQEFSCSICKKLFITYYSLKWHRRNAHTDKKRYSCTICKKEFTESHKLKRHMSSHDQNKEFTCSICDKIFTLNSSLRRHLKRTHTAETKCSYTD